MLRHMHCVAQHGVPWRAWTAELAALHRNALGQRAGALCACNGSGSWDGGMRPVAAQKCLSVDCEVRSDRSRTKRKGNAVQHYGMEMLHASGERGQRRAVLYREPKGQRRQRGRHKPRIASIALLLALSRAQTAWNAQIDVKRLLGSGGVAPKAHKHWPSIAERTQAGARTQLELRAQHRRPQKG